MDRDEGAGARCEAEGPSLGVVIIHWNQPQRCRRTVERFAGQSVAADIIVIDNGSTPEALKDLRLHLPDVPVRALGHNSGFGPAANVGCRHWLEQSQYEFLVVAPHDALPEPDCLERMVTLLRARPRIGLASADVGDGATPMVDPYLGGISVPASVAEGWQPSDYPHGTLLMARRACLLDIGLFDERYFAYGEEIDLGLRAKSAGWEVGLVRGARVHNPTMRSGSAAVDYLVYRNTLRLVREHSGAYHAFIRLNMAVIELVAGLLFPSTRPPLFSPRGRVRGMIDFLRGRCGPPPAAYFELLDQQGEPIRRAGRAKA